MANAQFDTPEFQRLFQFGSPYRARGSTLFTMPSTTRTVGTVGALFWCRALGCKKAGLET
jgi:hypothetical protein